MRIALGLFLALVLFSECRAEDGLRHLHQVRLLVSELGGDAKKCGFQETQVRSAIELPLRAYTKLNFVEGGNAPLLILHVAALKSAAHCATTVHLTLHQNMGVTLPYQDEMRSATVSIYEEFRIMMTNPEQIERGVQSIEGMAKRLALAWQRQNPN